MLAKWNDFGLGGLDRSFSALGELRREMDRIFSELDRGFGTPSAFAFTDEFVDAGWSL